MTGAGLLSLHWWDRGRGEEGARNNESAAGSSGYVMPGLIARVSFQSEEVIMRLLVVGRRDTPIVLILFCCCLLHH